HDRWFFASDKFRGFGVAEHLSPRFLEANDLGLVPLAHFGDPVAEESVGENADLGSGFNEISNCRFHSSGSRSRDGQRELILRPENCTEHLANVAQDLEEIRIEVPDDRLRHRLINARIDLRRSRTEEVSLGRIYRRIGFRIGHGHLWVKTDDYSRVGRLWQTETQGCRPRARCPGEKQLLIVRNPWRRRGRS